MNNIILILSVASLASCGFITPRPEFSGNPEFASSNSISKAGDAKSIAKVNNSTEEKISANVTRPTNSPLQTTIPEIPPVVTAETRSPSSGLSSNPAPSPPPATNPLPIQHPSVNPTSDGICPFQITLGDPRQCPATVRSPLGVCRNQNPLSNSCNADIRACQCSEAFQCEEYEKLLQDPDCVASLPADIKSLFDLLCIQHKALIDPTCID
jgi:hypothetical protein